MEAVKRAGPKLVGKREGVQQGATPHPKAPQAEQPEVLQARVARLEGLLLLEGELRTAQSVRELAFCIANESRKVLPVRQCYILRFSRSISTQLQIDIVSNLSSVDRNAPAVRWLEEIFSKVFEKVEDQPLAFELPKQAGESAAHFPFFYGSFLPLFDKNKRLFSAVVYMGEQPATEGDMAVMARLQNAFTHAWLALSPRPVRRVSGLMRKGIIASSVLLVLGAMFIPVPMTSLAPLEVVARSPQIIAAPLDGVIEQMLVEPNSHVRKGDRLFQFVDTELSSRHAIAKRSLNVARAKLQTARQNSFGSGEGRRQMAVLKAELELADTELAYAVDQLAKTIVIAPVSGLVVFDKKTDWQGRPVSVGERVVEIANPAQVEYRLDLPVSDAFLIENGARVKVFLDSAPLDPKEAVLRVSSYRATLSAEDQLVYKSYALARSSEEAPARIGARGTGQIFGEKVTLGFYLFRRPLSAMRQYFGW